MIDNDSQKSIDAVGGGGSGNSSSAINSSQSTPSSASSADSQSASYRLGLNSRASSAARLQIRSGAWSRAQNNRPAHLPCVYAGEERMWAAATLETSQASSAIRAEGDSSVATFSVVGRIFACSRSQYLGSAFGHVRLANVDYHFMHKK